MSILAFLVSFLASTAGAICGIGGGVIIKPTLDLLMLDSYLIFLLNLVLLSHLIGKNHPMLTLQPCFLFSCRMEYGGRCIDIDFCRHIVSSLSFAGKGITVGAIVPH